MPDRRHEYVRPRPFTAKSNLSTAMPTLALHSFSKAIDIPSKLHNQPLNEWQTSARLTTLLSRFGIRVLGDLHGRKVVDFAWEKNCGPKLYMNWICLRVVHDSETGRRLVMVTEATAFILRTISL